MLFAFTSIAQGIQFEDSKWQEALEKAKVENKLLFVDAYTQWCGPCKRMAKHEFTQKEVGDYYNENFVNLKLDMETPNGRTFDSEYPVSAYPTMMFLDGDGKVVKRVKGGRKAAQLISMGEEVMKSHDFSGNFREQYEDGDRSYDVVFGFVKALNQSSKPSLKISNEYLKSNPNITSEQKLMFIAEAAVEADSRLFSEFRNNKNDLLKLLGEDEFNKKVRRACDNTVLKAVEYDFPDLKSEAISKAKELLTVGGDYYQYEADKKYAVEMRDDALYLASVKKLSKTYLKKDLDKAGKLVEELLKSKKMTSAVKKEVITQAKKYHSISDSPKSCINYASALVISKEYKKALKVLNKTIARESKAGNDTTTLEKFKKRLSKKMES